MPDIPESELPRFTLEVTEKGQPMSLSLFRKPNPGKNSGKPNSRKIPVLLLHGASANYRTFLNPVGPRCLADWLSERGFEPWLLNWRGNGTIKHEDLDRLRDQLDFDFAADGDVPRAIERIKKETGAEQICAVGHCMGAATLAQAIAGGLRDKHKELTHVVLLAIGLFYEPAADGRMRGQDYALERTWMQRNVTAIDPRPGNNWPEEIQTFYENWPPTSRPHQQPRSDMEELCNRVSFMFGQPYRELNLPPEMHEHPFLAEQFGSIPLRMYVHCAQNVRRGWAAKFDAKNDNDELISRAAQERFADLAKVTLITGAKNTIWHRDSIDRMYEWLRRTPRGRANSRREILREYAHQDLLWGKDAYKDVFPMIRDGLPPQEKSDS